MKKFKILDLFAALLICICISSYVTLLAADNFIPLSRKIIQHDKWIFFFTAIILLRVKISSFIKKLFVVNGNRKKYKQTIRLIRNRLERIRTDDENIERINDIEKRKIGLRVTYNCFHAKEKRLYEEYKGYYKEVEEHFCNSTYDNCELLMWDLKYIVLEYEKCKYLSERVYEKIIGMCDEIIHSDLNIKENMKVECITYLEKLRNCMQCDYLNIASTKLNDEIEDVLIKLGKKRIDSNLSKKSYKYNSCDNSEDRPISDLEFYAWYSSYMTYRKADLTCVQLYNYFKTMNSYYDKIRKMMLSEKNLSVELHKNEMLYIIDASQLYEALVYDDSRNDNFEEMTEITSDILDILVELYLKIN